MFVWIFVWICSFEFSFGSHKSSQKCSKTIASLQKSSFEFSFEFWTLRLNFILAVFRPQCAEIDDSTCWILLLIKLPWFLHYFHNDSYKWLILTDFQRFWMAGCLAVWLSGWLCGWLRMSGRTAITCRPAQAAKAIPLRNLMLESSSLDLWRIEARLGKPTSKDWKT